MTERIKITDLAQVRGGDICTVEIDGHPYCGPAYAGRDDVWYAVWTTARDAVRDLITPEQYETLMAPVEAARAVMRETDRTTTTRGDDGEDDR